jgi:type IV pilus assembly protein PilY1
MRLLTLLALSLTLAGQARAQGESDLSVLSSTNNAPPNVLLLFDTSGSMRHVVWNDDFNPNVFHDRTTATGCSLGTVPTLAGTNGQCLGSGEPADACPNNDNNLGNGTTFTCPKASFPTLCTGWAAPWVCSVGSTTLKFTLPHLANPGTTATRWSRNYLYWFMNQSITASAGQPWPIEMITRIHAGHLAMRDLVDVVNPDTGGGGYQENVRFGVGRLEPSAWNGGYVVEPIASSNKTSLMAGIYNPSTQTTKLPAGGNTPISEALVDMGRYFVGEKQNLGAYSKYDRNTTTGGSTSSPPPSPMDVYCRENFVVLITDGLPTADLNDHHGGAFDATFGVDYDGDGDETPGSEPSLPNGGTTWLDDVAFYLHENDLLDDAVMAEQNNITTYTIGFALETALLQNTATNGGGGYYTTSSASGLAADLAEVLLRITAQSGSFTAATVPAARTAFLDGFYRAQFTPSNTTAFWPGSLQAFTLDPNLMVIDKMGNPATDPNGLFLSTAVPWWDAGDELASASHPARNLYVTRADKTDKEIFSTASVGPVELQLTPADLTTYPNDPNVPFADTTALASAIVNYLFGRDAFDEDRDMVTTELRSRVLGDIFHSNPILVGAPLPLLLGEENFGPSKQSGTFMNRHQQRARRLYVGANDGWFHGFDAGGFDGAGNFEHDLGGTGGQEAFGYVPRFLLDKLKELPRASGTQKPIYADGSPSVADAWFPASALDTSKELNEWTTVLVTGMRNGGDGYLALDVTEPNATTGPHGPYPKYLWEFQDPNQPLGSSWSVPVLTRVKLRAAGGFGDHCGANDGDGDCREQWVAIFAGGYRTSGDPIQPTFIADPNQAQWEEHSKAIFVVELDTGNVLARLARDPNHPQLSKMTFALPSAPAVIDYNFDGFADVVYVGDLGGQLWKWDLSPVGVKSGGLVSNWKSGVLFRAPVANVAGVSRYRSFFFPPAAALLKGKLMLAFGSGERTDLDHETDSVAGVDDRNRFYVVQDPTPLDPNGTGASIPTAAYTESDLTEITDSLSGDTDQSDLGFFIKAQAHEKYITNTVVFAGLVITASYAPDPNAPLCEASGNAFLHVFGLGTGIGSLDSSSTTALGARRLRIGSGIVSDPRIVVSDTAVKVFVQSSDGTLSSTDPCENPADCKPEETYLIYWRQDL